MATVAAVALNLIFRLGIRRTETISLEIKADSREELEDLLSRLGQSWEVKSQAIERAKAVSNDLLELLRARRMAQGPVTLRISFDDLSLELVITYQGDLLELPPHRPRPGDLAAQKSFSQEFSGFFKDAYPDRVAGSARNGTSQIKLIFQT
jgi:NCS2 family nucleobase:cation symporter-2